MIPQRHILKITEIFPSIQGEGLRQGEATIFIRLTGCNLRCSFCDTKYAWKDGREIPVGQIIEKVKNIRKRLPADWVCITGGEPLLQDIRELVEILRDESLKIQVETNGTIKPSLSVDWYSISPKPEKYFYQPEYRYRANEVKLVVTRNLDMEVIKNLRSEFPENTPILLQPQSNRKWSLERGMKLLKEGLKIELKNIRLSVQLHKIYGIR